MGRLEYDRVLVAFDGSESATKALRRALTLAKDQDAALTVLTVDEDVPRYAKGVGRIEEDKGLRDAEFARLEDMARTHAEKVGIGFNFEAVVGHAAQSILNMARDGDFDLIVMGHTGHSGIWGTLLGSTTARVVDQATCDVLVVR